MFNFFGTVIDAITWFLATGWDIWSSLFAPLPYGDPYIATAAALIACYMAGKVINPGYRVY
ncbi:MAG: hypothetical protein IIA00_10755 [Proteobacteria bacterium]|nr:hypothetical protein [Pseudomonadota bacterium]